MTRPTNMTQPLPNLTTGYLGREAPNPIADPPDPIDRAAGIDVFVPASGDVAIRNEHIGNGLGNETFSWTPLAGSLLVAVLGQRDGTPTTPTDWTMEETAGAGSFQSGIGLATKVSDGTETHVYAVNGQNVLIAYELTGVDADSLQTTVVSSADPDGTLDGIARPSGACIYIAGYVNTHSGDGNWATPTDYTEDLDEAHNHAQHPSLGAAHRIVTSGEVGTEAPVADATNGGNWRGVLFMVESNSGTIVPGGPNATDDDDATYVDPSTDFYLRLDQAWRIRRAELRLAWENSGSRTVTIYGANSADFSDEVELASETVTATGSWTAQDETLSWSDVGSFEYVHLVVSVTARLHGWELYEASLDTVGGVTDHGDLDGLAENDHPQYALDADFDAHLADTTDAHDASAISYDDSTSGITAANVQAALEGRWEPVTNGDVDATEFVFEDGDIVMEWTTT